MWSPTIDEGTLSMGNGYNRNITSNSTPNMRKLMVTLWYKYDRIICHMTIGQLKTRKDSCSINSLDYIRSPNWEVSLVLINNRQWTNRITLLHMNSDNNHTSEYCIQTAQNTWTNRAIAGYTTGNENVDWINFRYLFELPLTSFWKMDDVTNNNTYP